MGKLKRRDEAAEGCRPSGGQKSADAGAVRPSKKQLREQDEGQQQRTKKAKRMQHGIPSAAVTTTARQEAACTKQQQEREEQDLIREAADLLDYALDDAQNSRRRANELTQQLAHVQQQLSEARTQKKQMQKQMQKHVADKDAAAALREQVDALREQRGELQQQLAQLQPSQQEQRERDRRRILQLEQQLQQAQHAHTQQQHLLQQKVQQLELQVQQAKENGEELELRASSTVQLRSQLQQCIDKRNELQNVTTHQQKMLQALRTELMDAAAEQKQRLKGFLREKELEVSRLQLQVERLRQRMRHPARAAAEQELEQLKVEHRRVVNKLDVAMRAFTAAKGLQQQHAQQLHHSILQVAELEAHVQRLKAQPRAGQQGEGKAVASRHDLERIASQLRRVLPAVI